jgi:hypothetical protein
MQFSTTVLLVLLAHALSPTQASATMALRTHRVDSSVLSKSFKTDKALTAAKICFQSNEKPPSPPPRLSRIKCDVAYHTPAWFDSFEDYSPIWLEAATTIRVLQREHDEISKELTSHRKIRTAAKFKFTIRQLQRKNDDLYRLIETLAPIPGHLHYSKAKQLQWYYYNILKRNIEPLKAIGDNLWVSGDQC